MHANTYAALKELEHLTKLAYDEVKKAGRERETLVYLYDRAAPSRLMTVDGRPFHLTLIYDKSNLSIKDAEAEIGDMAYLQNFTPTFGAISGVIDNYQRECTKLARFPQPELRGVGQGYAMNYGTVGAA